MIFKNAYGSLKNVAKRYSLFYVLPNGIKNLVNYQVTLVLRERLNHTTSDCMDQIPLIKCCG